MRPVLRFALLLCVLSSAGIANAAKPGAMDAPGAGSGPSRLPSIPSSTYPYYQTIRSYSFDNGGTPNAQGWTTQDMTAQYGVFWHVDDFSGLSDYLPLDGTKSMWCGVRPGVVTDPAYQNAPGYGDNWNQILRFPSITNPLGAGRAVTLAGYIRYDMENNYDRVDIEYRSPAGSGSWNLLGSFTGTAPTSSPGFSFTPSASTFEIRYVMTSDASASDESYGVNSNGAVVLDDISVFDNATSQTLYFQNFESYPVGTTNGGSWVAETPAAVGNYAGLVSGSTVYQAGTSNTTGMWSFFNGSSATWACGGHPSQAAVPYTPSPGSTRAPDYLYNEIRSPWIDLSVDQDNLPTDATMTALAMEFDVYKTTSSDGVFPGWSWRFVVNGVLQPWSGVTFLTTSPSWFGMSTTQTGGIPIPPGATHVQLALFASDVLYTGGGPSCHSQAPLFDNVRILRLYTPIRVTNTGDSGVGSLREAINTANSSPDFNSVLFFIPGTGAKTINLASPLPAITQPLWIDGFTQSGSVPNTQQFQSTSAQLTVVLDGTSTGANANGLLFAPGSIGFVRGLAIGGFSGAGIRYEGASLVATGCYIGLDGTGIESAPNGTGILGVSLGMDIGGFANEERMLISNSTGDGIRVMDGGMHIFNTHLGYDAGGFEMANQGEGIHVFKGYCQIGERAEGNECAGELTDRVWIEVSNIVVEPTAQDVSIHQVVMEGGYIDLNNDGETPNDPLDTDTGGNGLQNFPVLTSVGSTTVNGNMDGAPNTPIHVELYSGDGYQSQMHYLGFKDLTTNGSGHASFAFSCGQIAPGTNIRATATAGNNPAGSSTSEFGPWVTYNNTPPGSPSPLVNLYDAQSQLRATVQYDNALGLGNTFLTQTTPSSPPIPALWNVGGTPNYWDITTNIPYSGNVHVCVYYDPAQVPGPEGVLRLLHYQGGSWVNVTTSVDPVNNVICGVVSSLSPFVIAKPANATGVRDTPAPDTFALRANVPNPFNPATTIDYDVRRGGANVMITIFDVNGRLVRTLVDEHRAAGRYQAHWNGLDDHGSPAASGVYFYRMQAGTFTQTRKMVLLK
jgi:hypothetical protein